MVLGVARVVEIGPTRCWFPGRSDRAKSPCVGLADRHGSLQCMDGLLDQEWLSDGCSLRSRNFGETRTKLFQLSFQPDAMSNSAAMQAWAKSALPEAPRKAEELFARMQEPKGNTPGVLHACNRMGAST